MGVGLACGVDSGGGVAAGAIEENVQGHRRDRGQEDTGFDQRVDGMGHPHFEVGCDQGDHAKAQGNRDDEKVVAVAAIEADYRKASYSNYGTYTDISAPGGSLDGDGRIWSTTTERSNNYEYLAGTSMACPLVSGVAALVIEKYGEIGRAHV